jgi:predicted DCC family thiol-disulfide oxidoreductase YuxK
MRGQVSGPGDLAVTSTRIAAVISGVGTSTTPLLVFDGDCGFCTSSADWVQRRWSRPGPRAVAWQGLGDAGLARLGLTVADVRGSAWWVEPGGRRFGAHMAIGKALRSCRRPWRWLGGPLLVPPGRWIARSLYPLVARHRHRLPGGTPACRAARDPFAR